MTPQENQQPRKVTVDLAHLADDFAAYVQKHFAEDKRGKSRALRIAVQRLLKRPPSKRESGDVPQGRPKVEKSPES